jgi:serine/threonine protein kinase
MAEAMAPTQADEERAVQPPLPPEQIAPHFPQLEILGCLGRGGMGVVYKAQQKSLGRFVALKLLAPERVDDPKFAERFAYEAQALAALNHPNIVTIYDFGQAGGFYFLLMEFVDGMNLRQLLGARKFTPEEALAVVPPLCDALQFAHDRGFVHRDIKPENLLLDKAGRVKVADFGIAKMLGTVQPTGNAGPFPAPENATLAAIGTPGYSAPEQRTDPQRVDSRADIYSLGVVIYEMLTGELPGKRIEPPSHKVQVDVRLDEVVLRALEMKPEFRYQQVSEVKTLVETIVQSPDPRVPPTPAAGDPISPPIKEIPKTMKSKTVLISIIASACLLLVAGIVAVLFFTGDETIHIRGIPRDWSCLSGDISQWDSAGNVIYGHTSNGDSILASARQYDDVTLSAMVSTTNREATLAFRMQDPDDGYLACFGPDGTATASWNGGHIWLIKRKGGEEKQLATFNRGGLSAPGQFEKLTVIARGPRLEVRLNDVTIMHATDRTFAAGFIGLRIYGDSKYPCDGVFSNLTVRARRSSLFGEAETSRQAQTDADSQSVASKAAADMKTSADVDQPSTSTPSGSTTTSIPIPVPAPSVGADYPVAATNTPAANHAATFGPVMERTIYDYQSGKDWLLNLVTGEIFSLPPGLNWEKNSSAVWEWLHQNGIHIMGFTEFSQRWHEGDPVPAIVMPEHYSGAMAYKRGLYGFEMEAAIMEAQDLTFETVTPLQISNTLQTLIVPAKGNNIGPFLPQFSGMAWHDTAWQGTNDYLYAFQTDDGQSGVLQITGFIANPGGVKIRYKLVLKTKPNQGLYRTQS